MILSLLLSAALAGPLSSSQIDQELPRTRADYAATEQAVEQGSYSKASFELGGGQNPREIVIHWQGGTEKDFMEDPYAEPFRLRRVQLTHVLPAVGPATATWYFRGESELFFAFLTGPDAWGVSTWDMSPTTELRAYFGADGQPWRVIYTDPEGKRQQVDNPTQGKAWTTGAKLAAEGKAILQAVDTLAR